LKIPKPSDEKLVASFYSKCVTSPFFKFSKAQQVKMEFIISHFACEVKYSINGFVEKNRNEIAIEIFDCFQ
jgi:myosin-5